MFSSKLDGLLVYHSLPCFRTFSSQTDPKLIALQVTCLVLLLNDVGLTPPLFFVLQQGIRDCGAVRMFTSSFFGARTSLISHLWTPTNFKWMVINTFCLWSNFRYRMNSTHDWLIVVFFLPYSGKALCLLMKSDFTERAQRSGDILYNVVHLFALQGKSPSQVFFSSGTRDSHLSLFLILIQLHFGIFSDCHRRIAASKIRPASQNVHVLWRRSFTFRFVNARRLRCFLYTAVSIGLVVR